MIKQAKFTYSPLGEAFEKQTEKQVDIIKSLNLSNKEMNKNKLRVYFQGNMLNDSLIHKWEVIIKLQDIIQTDKLNYKSHRRKT